MRSKDLVDALAKTISAAAVLILVLALLPLVGALCMLTLAWLFPETIAALIDWMGFPGKPWQLGFVLAVLSGYFTRYKNLKEDRP